MELARRVRAQESCPCALSLVLLEWRPSLTAASTSAISQMQPVVQGWQGNDPSQSEALASV